VAMLERVRTAYPTARLDGFLIQPMVSRRGATELLVGLSEDPVFGPLVAFGQGGIAVEVVHDTSLELPPLNPLLARRLMARTGVWDLLRGYRGKPPADLDAIVEILIRLGQLAADHPEIQELDINPLLADVAGAVALDARIRIASAQSRGASSDWESSSLSRMFIRSSTSRWPFNAINAICHRQEGCVYRGGPPYLLVNTRASWLTAS
jgi:acetyltransferase